MWIRKIGPAAERIVKHTEWFRNAIPVEWILWDERLTTVELVIQQPRKPLVPALGHLGQELNGLALLLVVVDIEMLGLQHPKLERVVLNFVSTEVLCVRR